MPSWLLKEEEDPLRIEDKGEGEKVMERADVCGCSLCLQLNPAPLQVEF